MPFGEEYVKEFLMHQFDVPMAKSFTLRTGHTLMERCRGVVRGAVDLGALSEDARQAALGQSAFAGYALYSARLNVMDKDQGRARR